MNNESIKVAAKEFCVNNNIESGWTQEQHVGFQFNTIADMLGIEVPADREELLSILTATVNPSAFRQKLEKASVLKVQPAEAKATGLANKYASIKAA